MLGKIEGKRRRGWQRMRWLDSITDSVDINFSKLRERVEGKEPGGLQSMGSKRVRHNLATEDHYTDSAEGSISGARENFTS